MFYGTEECLDTLSQLGVSKPRPKIDTCNDSKSNSGDQDLIQLCCHDESIDRDTDFSGQLSFFVRCFFQCDSTVIAQAKGLYISK